MSIEPKQTRTIIITGANNYTCHAKIHTHTHTQAFSLFGFIFFYIVFSFYIIIFVVCLSEINFILFYCFQKIVCQYFLPTTSTTTTTYYYNILSYSSSCLRSLSLLPILSFPFFFSSLSLQLWCEWWLYMNVWQVRSTEMNRRFDSNHLLLLWDHGFVHLHSDATNAFGPRHC